MQDGKYGLNKPQGDLIKHLRTLFSGTLTRFLLSPG